MIEDILPSSVIADEAYYDRPNTYLFPEEEVAIGKSVEKRRQEFITGRACVRRAFARLNLPAVPVPVGSLGEPQWPAGIVGSITHCKGYRACAIAWEQEIITLGIDAEPNEALPSDVLSEVLRDEELERSSNLTRSTPSICWDRLIFSAKEAVYKAWFPLTGCWLGFDDAILTVDPSQQTFFARLLAQELPVADGVAVRFAGRWVVRDGLVLTAVAIARGNGLGVSLPPEDLQNVSRTRTSDNN